MPYRRLTEAEMQTFVEEFVAYQRWRVYAAYATDLYGAAAERVDVVAGIERGDEFRYLVIDAVEVFDAQGRQLDPDLSTDWWRSMLHEASIPAPMRGPAQLESSWLEEDDNRQDWMADAIGERRAALPVPPGGYDTFWLSRPPKRRHRNIYAPE